MTTKFASQYAELLTTPEAAVELIPSGTKMAMGLGIAQPPALLKALAARAEAGRIEDVDLYYLLSTANAADTVLKPHLTDRIRPYSLFHGTYERALDKQGVAEGRQMIWFVPSGFQQAPRVMIDAGVETLVTTVAPMDAEGRFSLGTNADYALALSRTAKRVIVEVNANMPQVQGDCFIPLSQVTAIVENDVPLIEAGKAAPLPQDLIIGKTIAAMIEDGSTIQMGIGALPDAVCEALSQHRDLGVHTELLTPGLVELMRLGVINNARKSLHPGKSIFAFSMGQKSTYDYLHNNGACAGHPVDYVNDPAVIAKNDQMVSVNATLQIDLFGACCSEYLNGRQYTASGGQLDFVRGATASKGGKSIIACHSTAAKGKVSRIVARLDGPVTVPRNDIQYVVTEHGVANLRGLSVGARAMALIGLADPAFREELTQQAREMGLI